MRLTPRSYLVPLLLAAAVVAQQPSPGLRLMGSNFSPNVDLIDELGNTVHTWATQHLPGLGCYLLPDGTLLRATLTEPTGNFPPGVGGGVQRLDFDGNVLWDYQHHGPGYTSHHDICLLPSGNVLMIVWEELSIQQVVDQGRNPALLQGDVFRPDAVVEVRPTSPTTGEVVWEWHVMDHVIQDYDASKPNFGAVAAHPERLDLNFPPDANITHDWNHLNGIDYDPVHDWIALSSPHNNEIWIIDHSTTTAEAAGHTGGRWGKGGDLLYRWGNPQAHRAGTAVHQQLFFQHDPRFVPDGYPGAGNLTLFNNRYLGTQSGVFELQLPTDAAGNFVIGPAGRYGPVAPSWVYTAPGFYSQFVSSAQRLPNGNTLICSGNEFRVFEVQPDGTKVWEHNYGNMLFQAQYYDDSLWADRHVVSASQGGAVGFDLIAGSARHGDIYLLLGSISGTSPGTLAGALPLPLNPDPLYHYMLRTPNNGPWFADTRRLLGPLGEGSAAFAVPPGTMPPQLAGLAMHFAFVAADAQTLQFTHTSNAVPVVILP